MELLNLFEDIKIENTTRLSSEDKKAMEDMQEKLDDTRNDLIKYIEFYRSNPIRLYDEGDRYSECNYNRLITNFVEKVFIPEIKDFISEVYAYFRDKYKVELKTMEHSGDYSIAYRPVEAEHNLKWFLEVDYKILVDDIIEQLGGFSFEDKALEEVTTRVKKECKSFRNETITTVKSNSISIKDYTRFDSSTIKWFNKYELTGHSKKNIIDLLRLLTHNEDNILENKFLEIESYLTNKNWDFSSEFELEGLKVKSIKVFKNGKIQIKFVNGAEALHFANKYLGYNS